MPRDDITKIYTPPEGTYGVPDELIESGKYNAFVNDLRDDFSEVLPIEMGGTGSDSAEEALTGLGALSTFFLAEALISTIAHFCVSTPPEGWLVCNGDAISRSQYPKLFQRIGTTFGAGNGSSTFNLPDLRGEFIRGLDLSRAVDTGRTLGSAQSGDNETHGHTGTSDAGSNHDHGTARINLGAGSGVLQPGTGQSWVFTVLDTTSSSGSHSHSLTTGSTGSEFRPRNVALVPCILAFLPRTS